MKKVLFGAMVMAMILSIVSLSMANANNMKPQRKTKNVVLNADIYLSSTQIKISNNDDFNWTNVRIILDLNEHFPWGGWYELKQPIIESKNSRILNLTEFATNDGVRFNPFSRKVQDVTIYCDTPKGKGAISSGR